jgi:hypothetical protein
MREHYAASESGGTNMGFMDKVKATVKSGAEQAATKAQEEYERMQTRRDLSQAYEDLGTKAFELADRGDLSHADLTAGVERIRTLKAQLAAIGTEQAAAPAPEAPANPSNEG